MKTPAVSQPQTPTRRILSREDILAAPDRTVELISVPEWGGDVFVRSMTGYERDRYEESLMIGHGKKQRVSLANARAKLVALTLCDESGKNLLFTEADVIALGRKNAFALQRVFEKAQEMAGLSEGDLDEMTENLDQTDEEGSGTN